MKPIIEWIREDKAISPARAVLHPAWILAVTTLLVNDHIIKGAEVVPTIAGKLSDFAGLFFAPVLLAALLGVKSRRGLLAATGAVGAVFAMLNLSPAVAAWWDGAVSMVTPFHTTPDPTDLIALVALPVGLAVLEPAMRRRPVGSTTRLVEAAAVTVGGLASMATSPGPCNGVADCAVEVTESSQVSILNKTNELHVLRIRYPRGGIDIDCDEVERDPNEFIRDGIFDTPVSWFVQSGQEIPIRNNFVETNDQSCRMALVESDTLADILVFWDNTLETKTYPFDADIPPEIPADPQTIVIEANYDDVDPADMHEWRERSDCGSRADLCADAEIAPLAEIPPGAQYRWKSQHTEPLHHVRSAVQQGTLQEPPEECRMPGAESGLAWETPPQGDRFVVGLEEGADGCHELQLAAELESAEPMVEGWWLCAPWEAVSQLAPADDGSLTRIAIGLDTRSATLIQGGYEGLRIDATRLDPEREFQDFFTMHVTRGYGVPDAADFGIGVTVREGCDPVEGACGQVALPVNVQIQDFNTTVRPGESVSVGEVLPAEIHVVRADYRPVLDLSCDVELPAQTYMPQGAEGRIGYLETVIIAR
jgi:hypothetical protein